MAHTLELASIVQREMKSYNDVDDWKATSAYLEDPTTNQYSIIIVPDADHPDGPTPTLMLMARVVDDTVLIYEDITDRPLFESLVRAGIPREHIVLVYAGETLEDKTNGSQH